MNVRPTTTGPASSGDTGALSRARSSAESKSETPDGARSPVSQPDQVELSDAARELQANVATPSVNELGPDRMRTILGRMSQGFYDRPDVRDRIIDRLALELEPDPFAD